MEPETTSKKRKRKGPGGPTGADGGGNGGAGAGGGAVDAALHAEAQRRYLNYALSVITSRALPDVRDGLKPVQRRILYAMFNDERLTPDAKYRKSATVVGAVLGRYHPHGDTAVYDAMVRMAQSFSLRAPLVDGHGNFGSLDGDGAAAYRYTECRLTPMAMALLEELKKKTVDHRANFDGTSVEPVVLPARTPNLLVNGATGIAVGMATNIPPHNLGEVVDACLALIDDKDLTVKDLLKHIKGPDFPTGGQILNSRRELAEIYESGQGAVKCRGEYVIEQGKKGQVFAIITSIPYYQNKSTLVEAIADVVRERKLPQLLDIRDESTDDVRVVLEIKNNADPDLVMAYLFKHTPLQQNFSVNLTCLTPTAPGTGPIDEAGEDWGGGAVCVPQRLDLKSMLRYFLDFRFQVVTRRLTHELKQLMERIHILEGFAIIFDLLDEAIKIIRLSEGKQDAAAKLIKRFGLDEIQTDAILELRLYKLAKLEIFAIREELEQKTKEAKRIETILRSQDKRWGVVKTELGEVKASYADKRRTTVKVGGQEDETVEISADAFIEAEDTQVIVTRDGWVKRQREVKDPAQTRIREGDEVLAVIGGSTKEAIAFFTSHGTAYVTRFHEIPATTGYGSPLQALFKFKDGERVIGALSMDPRLSRAEQLLAVTREGYGLRFATEAHLEVSTRAGRRYAKPADGDEVVAVCPVEEQDFVCVATEKGSVLVCRASEVNVLANPGKGVTVIKVADGDRVIGAAVAKGKKDAPLVIVSTGGKTVAVGPGHYKPVARGGKGHAVAQRSKFEVKPAKIEVVSFTPTEVN